MSDETTPGRDSAIDPRFDPAFQRGFEGAVTTSRRRPSIGTPAVVPAQQQAAPATTSPYIAVPEVKPTAEVAAPVAAEPEVEEETSRTVNPFVIALWVIAAALVLVGGYLMQWARTTFLTDSLSTNIDYVTIEIVKYGAPLLVVLGLATAIGLVFLHAIGWRKRH